MSDWIRTDYRFDERSANLLISNRRTQEVQDRVRNQRDDDPETLCRWLTELIEFERPDLKGILLWGIRFDFRRQAFVVGAMHKNFTPTVQGEELPEIQL